MEEKDLIEIKESRPLDNAQRLMTYYQYLRKMQKVNPTDLERQTGVSRPTIYKYEKGQSIPALETMNRLLEPLGYKLGIVPLEDNNENEKEREVSDETSE